MAAEVAKISDFIDSSRDKRKWSEDNVRTLQTQIKTAYKRMVDSKKGYEIRCREEIQVNLSYQDIRFSWIICRPTICSIKKLRELDEKQAGLKEHMGNTTRQGKGWSKQKRHTG